MQALLNVPRSEPGEKARVVITSSSASYFTGVLNWNLFTDTPERRSTSTLELYNQSKHVGAIIAFYY
jgi:hypothetical protein